MTLVNRNCKEAVTNRITFRLHTASRLIKQMSSEQLKQVGLTHAQWRALSGVCTEPGATLQQLTTFAHISQPLMSQAMKALEQRSLVSRGSAKNDKRSSVFVATKQGIELYQQAYEAMLLVDEKVSYLLGPEEAETFKSLLDKLIAGFE